MDNIAEAFEVAEQATKKFEKKPIEPSKITDRQLRYAMVVVGHEVKRHDAPYGYDRGDLFQAAMIKIVSAINRNPDLKYGWMKKTARWACISAIRQYRFDTDRGDGFRSSEWLPDAHSPRTLDSYPNEINGVLERLTERQQQAAVYLAMGYTEKEIAESLGVHHSNIGQYKEGIRRRLQDES